MNKETKIKDLEYHVLNAIKQENRKVEAAKEICSITKKIDILQKRKKKYQILLYSISGAAAVFLITLLILKPFEQNLEQFYIQNFNSESFTPFYRGDTSGSSLNSNAENIVMAKRMMSERQWTQAMETLKPLANQGGAMEIESLWLISLCCAQTGDHKKCSEYLSRLIQLSDKTYRKEAKKLRKIIR